MSACSRRRRNDRRSRGARRHRCSRSPVALRAASSAPRRNASRTPSGRLRPASTSSRLDAFLLPDSLKFAEYNGEAPAGAGYTETLAEVFRQLPIFDEFTRTFEAHSYPLSAKLLDALIASYIDWGGTDKRPQMAIVDWREVPTWTEFEILKSRFERMGVPVVLADPRDLEFNGKSLIAHGKKIDLLYRRVLINDIVARPQECAALVKAYEANAMCMTNTFRCKIPHVKAFFAVLTDEQNAKLFSRDEQQLIRNHIPWTRVVTETRTHTTATRSSCSPFIRKERQNLVLKPSDEYGGTGVTLGWESDEKSWDATIEKALAAATAGGDADAGSSRNASLSAAKFSPTSRNPAAPTPPSISKTCSSISRPIFSAESSPASSPASAPPASPTSPAAAAKSPPSA